MSLFFKKGFMRNIDLDLSRKDIYDNMDALSKHVISSLKRRKKADKTFSDIVELTLNTPTIPRMINTYSHLTVSKDT